MSNIRKPTLWIVSELFYPDQTSTSYILSKIADKMTEKYDVNVITTNNSYQHDTPEKTHYSIDKNINIIRVGSKNLDKNKLGQRLIRMIRLTDLLFSELKKRIKENDKLLIPTNPATLLLKCARLKKSMDIEFNILVHDVFPENAIPAGIISSKRSLIFKCLSNIFNKRYSIADKLIVLGRDMYEILSMKVGKRGNPQITIIENWGDIENIKPAEKQNSNLQKLHSQGKISIQYAGNIGRVQGLETFIWLMKESNNKNLFFDLYGDGAVKDELQKNVINNNLDKQIHFHGTYSRDDQNRILNNTDIALVILAEGMYGLGVPSKAYNILAAGKPILFIGDTKSEIGRLIQEEAIGYAFNANEHIEIIEFLRAISTERLSELSSMGKKARRLVEQKFSEKIILDKFLQTI